MSEGSLVLLECMWPLKQAVDELSLATLHSALINGSHLD